MGAVEDGEPLSKRVKVSQEEVGSLLSKSTLIQFDKHLRTPMANPMEEALDSKGVIKRVEFVRVIAEALHSLGYERSGALLEEESGICLHSLTVNLFRKQLLDGRWDDCITTLQKIGVMDEKKLKSAMFYIFEQKYFEHLKSNQVMDALNTLRNEIAPLCIKKERLHELSGYVIFSSETAVLDNGDQNVNGAHVRLKLLAKLQKLLPPSVMVPERRLEKLIGQALSMQRNACVYHNSTDSSLSLYTDHRCSKKQIPSLTTQVLHAHNDDVWFLQFSNKGKYLASSSRDKSAIIWEVLEDGKVTLKHILTGHEKPVLVVAWSPDDQMLLTCGMGEAVRCWDVRSGDCIYVYEKSGTGMISCCWFPDGRSIITGLMDCSTSVWDLDGKEQKNWKGKRTVIISDVAITADSRWIISISRVSGILLMDKESKIERMIEEDSAITSFSLSKDSKFLLVNLENQEIHKWSIEDDLKLVGKYKGHKRSRFVIRSCFGGLQDSFIASGSEDSQVYIWHRSSADIIEALPGHSGPVNSVSWNPACPHMLASASDDGTVRIWGLSGPSVTQEVAFCNGAAHCNGNSTEQFSSTHS